MIISGPAADAEISKVEPAEIEAPGLDTFAYLRLTDEDFERLSYALAKRSAPHGADRIWDDAALMVRGADAGRDVLLTKAGRAVGVVQCKRLESQMALPAVFREIAKLVLFAAVNGDLRFDNDLVYFLSVARDPATTVVDYFARRAEVEPDKTAEIKTAAREVRDSYVTLEKLDDARAEQIVLEAFPKLKLNLLRPVDLDEWLGREPSISTRFFRQRLVVDNEVVREGFAGLRDLLKGLKGDFRSMAPVTDEDLKILRELIEDTPESHRLNVGIAMLFGFPREMFAARPDLETRIGRLMQVLNEISRDYTDWVFTQVRAKADEIGDSAEAMYAPPLARLVPVRFLSHVAGECLEVALSGSTMSEIIAKLSNAPRLDSDEARLRQVRQDMLAEWSRYLAGDFSRLAGEADVVASKRAIIAPVLDGLRSPVDIARALDEGIELLEPKMLAAADALRATCKHKTSIVLTGTRGIDSADAVKRLADTVRGLEALKPREGTA